MILTELFNSKESSVDTLGVSEGHNNSKTIITEALIAQKLWENAGRKLMEAQLTVDQINQIFQQIQQGATAAGGNRTLIGKGKDAAGAVSAAWTDLKDKIYNSKPMSGFAAQYDKAAEKLKQATGGDAGAMKYIQKYRDFATKNPMLQSAIYAALIAASGISGVGLAGAAALGLFKLVDQALQGKDIRSAAWSGLKTGATAFAAGQIGQALKGQPGGGGDLGEYPDGTPKMPGDGVDIQAQHGDFSMVSKVPDGTDSVVGQWNPAGPTDTVGSAAYQAAQQGGVGALKDMASDPNLSPIAQKLAADLAAGKDVAGAGEYLRKAMQGAAQKASMMGDMPDGSANAGMRQFMSLQNLFKAADDAGLTATLKESVTLSESQIFLVIGKIVERQRKLDEGLMDTIKGAAGKAVNYAKTKGTNLTTKITADKLLQAWKKAGSPTDSVEVYKVITGAGVPTQVAADTYSAMKIPMTAPKGGAGAFGAMSSQLRGGPQQAGAAPSVKPATAGANAFGGMAAQLGAAASTATPAATTAPAKTGAPTGFNAANVMKMPGMEKSAAAPTTPAVTTPATTAPATTAPKFERPINTGFLNPKTGRPYLPSELRAEREQEIADELSKAQQAAGDATAGDTTAGNTTAAVSATTTKPAATTAATTKPAATTAAAGKFPGEDPQGAGYVGRREVARRQAARDAAAAKKPATPNFAGPTGYSSVNYAPNIKTGISLPKPTVPSLTSTPAKVKPLAAAPATKVTSGGVTPAERAAYDKKVADAAKLAVAETVKQVKHMLESVTTRDDVEKIKKYIDRQFTKHGLISELAFAQRNHLIERVVYIGAQRRREHARMS
jgi:hypothetical protein